MATLDFVSLAMTKSFVMTGTFAVTGTFVTKKNMMHCFECKKEIDAETKLSFREECPHCGADAHVCYNCQFYDPSAYNECKETSAERVLDKDKRNYCDYFSPGHNTNKTSNSTDDAKKKLEDLFK